MVLQRIMMLLVSMTLSFSGKAQLVYRTHIVQEATVKVYVTTFRYEADLFVYLTDFKTDATDNNGIWYITQDRNDTKNLVYFTRNKTDADLIVYYTDYKLDAGWKNEDKKHLIKPTDNEYTSYTRSNSTTERKGRQETPRRNDPLWR